MIKLKELLIEGLTKYTIKLTKTPGWYLVHDKNGKQKFEGDRKFVTKHLKKLKTRMGSHQLKSLIQVADKYKGKGVTFDVVESINEAKRYKLGDSWSKDFDYVGMLKWGMSVDWRTDEERLLLLHHSLEDVNYHNIAVPLWDAMVALKTDKESKAKSLLKKVNNLSKKELK